MCSRLRGLVVLVVVGAAACSPASPEAADDTLPPDVQVSASGVPAGRPSPGRVAVEVFTEASRVAVTLPDVPRSSVDVQIAEILSEFDTAETTEGSVVTLPEDVLFDFDRADLKPAATATLGRLVEAIQLAGDRRVTIRGHTDARGADDYNQDLSDRRAAAVRDAFLPLGVDGGRLDAAGFGETQPVAPNEAPDGTDDPAGRQRNRRVEIVLEGA